MTTHYVRFGIAVFVISYVIDSKLLPVQDIR